MTRTPKDLFQATPHFVLWKDFVNRQPAAFETGLQAALSEMLNEVPAAATINAAWDGYCQLVGARRLMEILSRLHEPAPKATPLKPDELNYNA